MSIRPSLLSSPFAFVGRPVIDRAGLTGTYDFTLNWSVQPAHSVNGVGTYSTPSDDAPSIFRALQEVGLKLQPAAERAGITKVIGWHIFRRTLATLLQSSGASVKTTQELMRHASPVMTLGTYAQAVTSDKREAQTNVAALFVVKSAGRKKAKAA